MKGNFGPIVLLWRKERWVTVVVLLSKPLQFQYGENSNLRKRIEEDFNDYFQCIIRQEDSFNILYLKGDAWNLKVHLPWTGIEWERETVHPRSDHYRLLLLYNGKRDEAKVQSVSLYTCGYCTTLPAEKKNIANKLVRREYTVLLRDPAFQPNIINFKRAVK